MGKAAIIELSDAEIVARIMALCLDEARGKAEIIRCLIEIEARRIHLYAAYPSMFDYCMHGLKMSHGVTYRRLAAARLARRFPQVLPVIASGKLHLSSLLLIRDHVTEANVDELLACVAGKSSPEIIEILAARSPRPDVPDSIAPVVEPPSRSRITPLSASRFEVKLTVSAEVRDKLERARDLMRHSNPNGDLAVIFERALDGLVAKLERERRGKATRPRAATPPTKSGRASRSATRDVYSRDAERCTFVSASGKRCHARGFLELDHVHSRALGGDAETTNLRIYCRPHNLLHAEEVFGAEHVAKAIASRRRKSKVDASQHEPAPRAVDAHESAFVESEPAASPAVEQPALVDEPRQESAPVIDFRQQPSTPTPVIDVRQQPSTPAPVIDFRQQPSTPAPVIDVRQQQSTPAPVHVDGVSVTRSSLSPDPAGPTRGRLLAALGSAEGPRYPGAVSTIAQSFETIIQWMRANGAASIPDNLAPGATAAALAASTSMFGFPVAGELAELWSVHDGQIEEEHGFVEYYDLCSMQLARVSAEDIYFALEMIRDGKEVSASGLTDAERASKAWIRIAGRDSDGYAVNAESGRVFALEHDEVPPLKLVAPSVSAWLADYAARVVAGEYEVEDGYGDVYLSKR